MTLDTEAACSRCSSDAETEALALDSVSGTVRDSGSQGSEITFSAALALQMASLPGVSPVPVKEQPLPSPGLVMAVHALNQSVSFNQGIDSSCWTAWLCGMNPSRTCTAFPASIPSDCLEQFEEVRDISRIVAYVLHPFACPFTIFKHMCKLFQALMPLLLEHLALASPSLLIFIGQTPAGLLLSAADKSSPCICSAATQSLHKACIGSVTCMHTVATSISTILQAEALHQGMAKPSRKRGDLCTMRFFSTLASALLVLGQHFILSSCHAQALLAK